MAARPPSPTSATLPLSEATIGENRSSSDATLQAATRDYFQQKTPDAAPLTGAPVPEYDFEANLEKAYSTLAAGLNATARPIFVEIYDRLKGLLLPTHSLLIARCQIGIALTHDEHHSEGAKFRVLGKLSNDKVYINRAKWSHLPDAEKIATYRGLIRNYESLLSLFPKSDRAIRQEITKAFEDCKITLANLPAPLSESSLPVASPLAHPSIAPPSVEPTVAPTAVPLDIPPLAIPDAHESDASGIASLPVEPVTVAAPEAKVSPRLVTPGPVGNSSRIRTIFGLAIISLAALFAGVVIYKRFVVKR